VGFDLRTPIFLTGAAVLAYFTWRSQRSGKIFLKFSYLQRDEYPRLFQIAVWTNLALAVLAVAGAGLIALGQFPLGSDCVAPKGIWLTYHGVPLTCPDPERQSPA
jgi:hypothetical protein